MKFLIFLFIFGFGGERNLQRYAIYNNHAVRCMQNELWEEALIFLQKAEKLCPTSSVVRKNLELVMEHLGLEKEKKVVKLKEKERYKTVKIKMKEMIAPKISKTLLKGLKVIYKGNQEYNKVASLLFDALKEEFLAQNFFICEKLYVEGEDKINAEIALFFRIHEFEEFIRKEPVISSVYIEEKEKHIFYKKYKIKRGIRISASFWIERKGEKIWEKEYLKDVSLEEEKHPFFLLAEEIVEELKKMTMPSFSYTTKEAFLII